MFPLTKYETFLKFFNEDAAYKHAAIRISKVVSSMSIPDGINVKVEPGFFKLPNYIDCSRTGIDITLSYDVKKFSLLEQFYNGSVKEDYKFVDPYDILLKSKEVYINECKSLYDVCQKISETACEIKKEVNLISDNIYQYLSLIDYGYMFNNIIDKISYIAHEVYLTVNTLDDFITKCVEQNIKVDADYRDYVIEEFKKAAKGEKVNYDFGAWVCTPQAFDTNKSDIVETNDIINKENERFSEILNRINNDIVPCKTFEEVIQREG